MREPDTRNAETTTLVRQFLFLHLFNSGAHFVIGYLLPTLSSCLALGVLIDVVEMFKCVCV